MKRLIKKFIPSFLLDWYHFSLAILGALLYRFPSREIKVVGVTGTNGKTTVVDLTAKILEKAGFKVASISSIKFKIISKEWPNTLKMTMPGRLKIQKFLRKAVNMGCQYAVIEVTSQGITQYRHKFIDFDVVVFTNLSPEHIESHGSFEKYKIAKGKLFQSLGNSKKSKKVSIVNLDDKNSDYFLNFQSDEKYGYGISNIQGNQNLKLVKAENYQILPNGIIFSVENTVFNLKLLGKFNISNSLAAISIALSQGINLENCKKALEKIKEIPGRMEEIIKEPFKVFVDYAHTPEALESAYKTLIDSNLDVSKPLSLEDAKLICILGSAGGGRDKWKREKLGEIADKFCRQIILTNEDPYDENPEEIIKQVESGIKNPELKVSKILDRREAIKKSLNLAKTGDVIIITGKGCEPWMCVANDKKVAWDDRRIVKEEFEKIKL